MPELAEILIEEHKDGDRLELTLVQVALHDVVVLIAEEDAHVQRSALPCEPSQHGKVRDHIAAPVFREHDDLDRARQRAECGDILFAELHTLLVLLKALAIARHLGFICLVRQPLVEPSAIYGH